MSVFRSHTERTCSKGLIGSASFAWPDTTILLHAGSVPQQSGENGQRTDILIEPLVFSRGCLGLVLVLFNKLGCASRTATFCISSIENEKSRCDIGAHVMML